MEVLDLYLVVSYLYMLGVTFGNFSNGSDIGLSDIIYLVLSPIIFPVHVGYFATKEK